MITVLKSAGGDTRSKEKWNNFSLSDKLIEYIYEIWSDEKVKLGVEI